MGSGSGVIFRADGEEKGKGLKSGMKRADNV